MLPARIVLLAKVIGTVNETILGGYCRVLGFRVLGFRVLGFRVLGFRVLGSRVYGLMHTLVAATPFHGRYKPYTCRRLGLHVRLKPGIREVLGPLEVNWTALMPSFE